MKVSVHIFLFFLLLTVFLHPVWSRSLPGGKRNFNQAILWGKLTALQLKEFEFRLTPYFQIKNRWLENSLQKKTAADVYVPTQADYFTLARNFSSLSPAFKRSYRAALDIPTTYLKFETPGGHFEVYYIKTGESAVNVTDEYGFKAPDWRLKVNGPNGVPDYVDEVAWALDSVWSMEVDRFGFVEPFVNKDSQHPSSLYKIVITSLRKHDPFDNMFGLTIAVDFGSPGIGFTSFIEVRNNFNGFDFGGLNNYEKIPENALRITLAHEFFHSIQFSMIRDDTNDGMRASWLEATAILMEEVAFGYVNDYIGLMGSYFDSPTNSMLDSTTDGFTEYKNGMLAIYLDDFVDGQGINFVKQIFFNNYFKLIDFDQNLMNVSLLYGRSWTQFLGDFHARSYFTDSRTESNNFISDASLLPKWKIPNAREQLSTEKTKNVGPYAMQMFTIDRGAGHKEALLVNFSGDITIGATATDSKWALNVIFQDSGGVDVYKTKNIPATGKVTLASNDWQNYNRAIVIVTNGDHQNTRPASVTFETSPPIKIMAGGTVQKHETNFTEVRIFSIEGKLLYQTVNNSFTSINDSPFIRRLTPGTYILQTGAEQFAGKRASAKLISVP